MTTTATISYLWTKGRKYVYLNSDGYPGYVIPEIIVPQIRNYVTDKEKFYQELLNSEEPLIDEEDMLSLNAEYRYEVSHLENEWFLIESNAGKMLYDVMNGTAYLFGWEDEELMEDVAESLMDSGVTVKRLDSRTEDILERHGISLESEGEMEM